MLQLVKEGAVLKGLALAAASHIADLLILAYLFLVNRKIIEHLFWC
jgi:hypothetical protein